MNRVHASIGLVMCLSACASYPRSGAIDRYDLGAGYRFESLALGERNSDEMFVILAFSGGGTRAAALSYGVLEELDRVRFRWDSVRNRPCAEDCPPDAEERSLLDEVDVISSVSGGSFTAAYYVSRGREIFDEGSAFKKDFLFYPAQRDLLGRLLFKPGNWKYLKTRVELAGNQWTALFDDINYSALAAASRPYLILNATDALTGGRFEFTQEQFDLFCGDLSTFPLRRAVAASSAFPGLLTPMTLDSYVTRSCGFVEPSWFQNALDGAVVNYATYRRARLMEGFRDTTRQYIHVMDGGVADNLGLRAILQSMESDQVLNQAGADAGNLLEGGWSLLKMVTLGRAARQNPQFKELQGNPLIDNVVVIVVNARTNTTKDWGRRPNPPGALSTINASAGIPIGRLSWESMDLLRQVGFRNGWNRETFPGFYGFEAAFADIENDEERSFFENLGTNFQLTRYEVDCLVERGGRLLRESRSVTESQSRSFEAFVRGVLHGQVVDPPPAQECTLGAVHTTRGLRTHIIDVGVHYAFATATRKGSRLEGRPGLTLRISRPNGWGALFSGGPRAFDVRGRVGDADIVLGDFRLWTWMAGLGYTLRAGRLDITPGLTVGYGFGNFEAEDGLRDRISAAMGPFDKDLTAQASGSLVAQAGLHGSYDLTDRFVLTGFAQYMWASPRLTIAGETAVFERDLPASGLRFGPGVGIRVY